MKRNCLIAAIAWPVLLGAYFFYLAGRAAMPERLYASLAMATVVWMGLVLVTGTRFAVRDWRARRALERGERPRDGELVAAIGTIRPVFEPIHSPLSGTACVVYSYEIGPPPRGQGKMAKDYVGFGMTRCLVQTQYGKYFLGSFPVLEHVPKRRVADRRQAAEYIATAPLEDLNAIELARSVFAIHTQPPPVRRDIRFGTPGIAVEDAEVVEQLLVPGDTVTAFGKFVSASGSIVGDLEAKGYLRVSPGGNARRVSSFPWKAVGQLLGGLALIALANAFLVFILEHPPQ